MRNARFLAALGLMVSASAANADFSGMAAVVSDYDYRGITQTAKKPAVQLSIDYGHERGWYIGAWGSNIDNFTDGSGSGTASTEVDVYTGFKGSIGDLGWNTGFLYYTYAGASDLNFPEIYAKFNYRIVSAGVHYSNAFAHKDNDGAVYAYADLGIPAGPLTIGVHAGYSAGDGVAQAHSSLFGGVKDSYIDYSVGVSYTANNVTLGIRWVGYDAKISEDDRIILSISTALPWH